MVRLAVGVALLACLIYDAIAYKVSPYDSNSGRCKAISFHKEMTTWCTNNDKQIFVQKNGKWKLVDGRLDGVAVGPAGIWGILRNDNVYYRQGVSIEKPEGVMWSKLDGVLVQMTSGPEGVVWGITKVGELVYREGITFSNPMGNKWKVVDKSVLRPSYTSCNAKGCWVIGLFGEIMFRNGVTRKMPMGTSWTKLDRIRISSRAAEIESSADGHSTVVLMSNKNLYQWEGGFMGEKIRQGSWKLIGGPFANPVPAHGGFIAIANDFSVKFIMKVPNFKDSYKPMDQISAGRNGSVCGLSSEKIYQKQGQRWINVDGSLSHISCADHQMWGVNRYSGISYRSGASHRNHFGSSWKRIKGSLKKIEVCKFGTVYGLNSNDRIYKRGGITQDLPYGDRWMNIPGRLTHISCGNHALWGVNYEKKVHMKCLFPMHGEQEFQRVDKQLLRKVKASDAGYVFGICDKNILRMRVGVSDMNPMGSGWVEWMDKVLDVAPHKGGVFIINLDKQVKHASFLPNHM